VSGHKLFFSMLTLNQIFKTIDQLHSEWSMTDKASKLVWLRRKQNELNALAEQMVMSISLKGGRMTDAEKAEAQKLLEMINEVNAEGLKTINELNADIFKNLVKEIIRW